MKKCRITVMKRAIHSDLIEKYENPIEHTCDMKMGQEFISVDGKSLKAFAIVHGKTSPLMSRCWPTVEKTFLTAG